jgi:hypothetical protein
MLRARIGKALKQLHYPLETILLSVCWHMAYSLSLHNLEENDGSRLRGRPFGGTSLGNMTRAASEDGLSRTQACFGLQLENGQECVMNTSESLRAKSRMRREMSNGQHHEEEYQCRNDGQMVQ